MVYLVLVKIHMGRKYWDTLYINLIDTYRITFSIPLITVNTSKSKVDLLICCPRFITIRSIILLLTSQFRTLFDGEICCRAITLLASPRMRSEKSIKTSLNETGVRQTADNSASPECYGTACYGMNSIRRSASTAVNLSTYSQIQKLGQYHSQYSV